MSIGESGGGVVPGVNLGPRSGFKLLNGGCCCEREAENASRKGSGGIPRLAYELRRNICADSMRFGSAG